MSRLSVVFASVIWMVCVACKPHQSQLPGSIGQPCEVVVVDDAEGLADSALSVPMMGLPQSEPSFDVKRMSKSEFKGKQRLARNVLMVNITGNRQEEAAIAFRHNCYAKPQLEVTLTVGTAALLRQYLKDYGKNLRGVFESWETATNIARLNGKHSMKANVMMRRMFGYEMLVAEDMTWQKQGKNFLWLSNNALQGMQNLCVFTLNGMVEPTIERIDSVHRANLKGETDAMCFQIVAQSVVEKQLMYNSKYYYLNRGLWEMTGDAMGGPLVYRTIVDSLREQTLVVEAFVYAPETKKRNKLRQTEASLMTVRRLNEKEK